MRTVLTVRIFLGGEAMLQDRTFGFLTIAFGKKYRKIARNLIISYKKYGNTAPFCVVTDKKTKQVKDFDYIIETKPLDKGFFNKLWLDKYSPFYNTVFLDADCLVFNNISSCFSGLKEFNMPFSPLGKNLVISDLDNCVGYFDFDKTKEFDLKYTYIFNGGFYYFNKNSSGIFQTARRIASSEKDYGFPFAGDEPCLALSMSIHNCLCWDKPNIKGMSWFPRAKNMLIDIKSGKVNYQFGDILKEDETAIVHFGTFNTYRPFYKSVVWALKRKDSRFALWVFAKGICYNYYAFLCSMRDTFHRTLNFAVRCLRYAVRKIKHIRGV